MNKRIFFLLTALLIFISACTAPAAVETTAGSYENISVETLQTMVDERRDSFVLVNVHIPFQGNIPQTDLSIPYNDIEAHLDQLPENKDAEIVLYCRSGSMSNSAAAELVNLGYTNVKNLSGGFNAWKQAGLPLEMEQ
jgi:rhodanese-related sulfurtransferase